MEAITEELLRSKLQEGVKLIYEKGLVQAGEGNMSVRSIVKDEIIITPTYNKYYDLKKKDLVQMKYDGTVIKSSTKPSSEYHLHVELYKARPLANCVIHTHSPYATMMSVARKSIPILLEEQVIFLGGSVDISEFAIAHSDEFSINAIKAMGTKNGVLLANHGTLVCGRNVDDAIKMAELVEKLAFIYTGAEQLGKIHDIMETSCSRFFPDFKEKFATYLVENGKCD